MQLFTEIDDATAILRLKKGVYKQVKMYHRGDKVYVPFSGGFIRIAAQFDKLFPTSHPDIKVMEFEADGVELDRGTPVMRAKLKAAA